jgi:NhaA family Na+:H+ antiporter
MGCACPAGVYHDAMQHAHLPGRPASALRDFLHGEATGGIVLMAAAALAMLVANLQSTASSYFAMLDMVTGPVLNDHLGPMTPRLWINDGLMAIFFLLVGLEIKREVVDGRLASADRRRLPVIAAIAGMAVPALVYLLISGGAPGLTRGWAIPAATDIAFAIGVLALLGSRAPSSLKLFLTTVAIVDDMGAVAIIAVAYTDQINVSALAGAAATLAILYAIGRRGEQRLTPYMIGFVVLWLLTLMSGVHATIAGVVTAMLIPVKPSPGAPDDATSPLHRLEHLLHPWVAFAIVPLFGFANAGVSLAGVSLTTLANPLVLGIAAGLFVGKQVGIFGSIWTAEKLGIASRPGSAGWMQIYGIALLAGIGFTMSLFIGGLAFPGNEMLADHVKIGVLAGSILSAVLGFTVLRLSARPS